MTITKAYIPLQWIGAFASTAACGPLCIPRPCVDDDWLRVSHPTTGTASSTSVLQSVLKRLPKDFRSSTSHTNNLNWWAWFFSVQEPSSTPITSVQVMMEGTRDVFEEDSVPHPVDERIRRALVGQSIEAACP